MMSDEQQCTVQESKEAFVEAPNYSLSQQMGGMIEGRQSQQLKKGHRKLPTTVY